MTGNAQNCKVDVSVIIPVYNGKGFIVEAVHSVLTQTVAVAEILIVDDGSTDGISGSHLESLDPRVRFIGLTRNYGASFARNVGVQHAVGRWVAFLDADDTWMPTKLEVQEVSRSIFPAGQHLVFCNALLVDQKGACGVMNPIPSARLDFTGLLMKGRLGAISSTMVVERELAKEVGFSEERENLQDLDFLLRILRTGTAVIYVERPFVNYSILPGPDRISNSDAKVEHAVSWYEAQGSQITDSERCAHFVTYCVDVFFLKRLSKNCGAIWRVSGRKVSMCLLMTIFLLKKLFERIARRLRVFLRIPDENNRELWVYEWRRERGGVPKRRLLPFRTQ